VVFHNLNFIRTGIAPNKTDTPLIADPDAMLAFPLTAQSL